ncbi:NUDIX hydrolase [Sedimentitalea arenosa]|jgi:8-oxo-dGTP pyrophosphatase MutT (NUDIX family)|uniref:NUDIX hydrolase n=1 Tax=Sedimentitalea arenosa TaxID=2798803 RepID=A0A8J7J173_9RHOB|nr:NUDIX hydrolase [Arenibacterium arenosum]MBJ6371365.1 NUDIX hydrolase [Arenibacterium arenosum]
MLIKQLPITVRASHKSDVRTQFAALCFRIAKNKPQVLLVTSRGTGRWIIPKGWPMHGKTPAHCAEREAWEEAGVIGKAADQALGLFSYNKVLDGSGLPCVAIVYPVRVKSLAPDYPEKNQRRRKWFSPAKAANRVSEPELARILRDFDPKMIR